MNGKENMVSILDRFLKLVKTDPRISPAHISLYISILQSYVAQGDLQVQVQRDLIIEQAKISASTYHRCINQLHDYGYIDYTPSFDPKKVSTATISVGMKTEYYDKERKRSNHEGRRPLF